MNAALSPNSDYEGTETWGNPYTADEQRWMTAAKRDQDRVNAKLDRSIDSIDPEKIKAALRMGESEAQPAPQQKGSMVPSKDSIIKAFRSLSEPYKFEYIPTEKDGE